MTESDSALTPKCEDEGPLILTAEQHQRIYALRIARDTLKPTTLFVGNDGQGNDGQRWTVDDLLAVAGWILEPITDATIEHMRADQEFGRMQGYAQAIHDAITVVQAHASLADPSIMSAIRKLSPNADESPTDDTQLSFDDDEEPK